MYMDAGDYRKLNEDAAERGNGTVIELAYGMLGVKKEYPDGWWFIIVLIGNEEAGELNWFLYDWNYDEPPEA
jgi:hypothetical protein